MEIVETRFKVGEEFWTVEANNKQWTVIGPWKVTAIDITIGAKETTVRYTTDIRNDTGYVRMLENDKMFLSLHSAYMELDRKITRKEEREKAEEMANLENAAETASEQEMLA